MIFSHKGLDASWETKKLSQKSIINSKNYPILSVSYFKKLGWFTRTHTHLKILQFSLRLL